MDYNKETEPVSVENFPNHRGQVLDFALYSLKAGRSQMFELVRAVEPEIVPELEVTLMPVQTTASDNLAEIREQVRREAA